MAPKNSSAEIARQVIAELESSGLLKKLVKESVEEAFSNLVERLEVQEGRVLELEGQVKAQAKDLQRLRVAEERSRNVISAIEMKLDGMEQQSRSLNVRILGVEESGKENPEKVVMQLVEKKMGVSLSPADLDRCHRIGSSSNQESPSRSTRAKPQQSRPILVRFANHRSRALVMGARAELKGSDIFINEDLTQSRQNLLYKLRHCKKADRSWSLDGKIFAGIKNDSGGYTKKLIRSEADIAKL